MSHNVTRDWRQLAIGSCHRSAVMASVRLWHIIRLRKGRSRFRILGDKCWRVSHFEGEGLPRWVRDHRRHLRIPCSRDSCDAFKMRIYAEKQAHRGANSRFSEAFGSGTEGPCGNFEECPGSPINPLKWYSLAKRVFPFSSMKLTRLRPP